MISSFIQRAKSTDSLVSLEVVYDYQPNVDEAVIRASDLERVL